VEASQDERDAVEAQTVSHQAQRGLLRQGVGMPAPLGTRPQLRVGCFDRVRDHRAELAERERQIGVVRRRVLAIAVTAAVQAASVT
jgi:hypothetical protein